MNQPLGLDLMKGAFGPRPHDVYFTYDELTDELIVRLIEPTRPTYLEEIDGNHKYGLLVEEDSDEIVGFHLFNFERDHLPEPTWSNLRKVWETVKEAYRKLGYTKFHYEPSTNKRADTAPLVMTQRFYVQSAEILQRELVKSPA